MWTTICCRQSFFEGRFSCILIDNTCYQTISFTQCFKCCCTICWVITFWQFYQMFFEPVIAVVFIVCNTWAEYVDKGETFMIHCLLNQLYKLCTINHVTLCYECSTCSNCSFTNGQWRFESPTRSCFCNKTDIGTRGCLTFSQTIYMVIHYDVCHIYITFESMDSVTHTNSERITITRASDNF